MQPTQKPHASQLNRYKSRKMKGRTKGRLISKSLTVLLALLSGCAAAPGYLIIKDEIVIENSILSDFPILADTPQDVLSEIAQLGEVLVFAGNQTIFKEGDKASVLYGVVDGEVELGITVQDKILKTDIQYEESIQTRIETIENFIIIESIDPGEIFGWSAFIDPKLYTSTAKCSQPSKVISLPADELKSIFANNATSGFVFMERLSAVISQRLRNRTAKLIESWSQAFDVNRI